jgi:8-oxo-dGTP diphosphatase
MDNGKSASWSRSWGLGLGIRDQGLGISGAGDRRTYPERPIVSVGAIAIDGDRVLLVKRGHEPLKGQWSLPGGVVEAGEELHAALVREVREETSVDVEVGPVVEVLDRISRDAGGRVEYHYVIIDYLCRATGGALACASDAADARWVSRSDLASYGLTTKAAAVIARAFEMRE